MGRRRRRGAGVGLCHTGTNKSNWRCRRRSAVVRVEWYQRRTREVETRVRVRLGAKTRDEGWPGFGQSITLIGGSVSCRRRREEDERHTNVCCRYAHEGAGLGRQIRAAEGSGEHGREGRGLRDEERTCSEDSPLCVNTPTKQHPLSKAQTARGKGGLVLDFPSLGDDHNRTSTPRTRLCAHKT
jgi:hypothetical protein